MATFRALIEGVEDNNKINDGKWSDWSGMDHIEDTYGALDDEDITHAEATHIIESAIQTNGASLAGDLRAIELRAHGQNFAGSWWNRA